MEYLNTSKQVKSKQLGTSLHSIRNDFQLIKKNSSSLLSDLLNKILHETDNIEVLETQKFSHLMLENISTPIESFKLDKEAKKIPVIMKYTAFVIDVVEYSNENLTLLETTRNCKNNRIFECFLIKEPIDKNWNKVIHWAILFSVLQI